jgi:hypothetical protein
MAPDQPNDLDESPILTQIRTMGDRRVKVSRLIIYEGPASWVAQTLERSFVPMTRVMGGATIPRQDCRIVCSEEHFKELE